MATPVVGSRLRVWYEGDEKWFEGTIIATSRSRGHQIRFDEVEGEDPLVAWHKLNEETFDLLSGSDGGVGAAAAASSKAAGKRKAPPPPPPKSKANGKKKAPPAPVPVEEEDEEEDEANIAAAIAEADAAAAAQNGQGADTAICLAIDDDDDDDDVAEVAEVAAAAGPSSSKAAGKKPAAPRKATGARDDDDEEVSYAGHQGDLALVDFPHARQNCAACPFLPGKEAKSCQNCFCFVCDTEVSKCEQWDSGEQHCKATHDSDKWKDLRQAKRDKANGVNTAAANGGGAASSSAAAAAGKSSGWMSGYVPPPPAVTRWSCDELLEKAQQVYPRETPESDCVGLLDSVVLRPYQKQSIAFMIDVERSNDPTQASTVFHRGLSSSSPPSKVRGGWLADEVGMGKTMVVTCVVLAERATELKPISDKVFNDWLTKVRTAPAAGAMGDGDSDVDDEGESDAEPDSKKMKGGGGGIGASSSSATASSESEPVLEFGLTMVVVNNTLVRQWYDEITKFAPTLAVHTFYATAANKEAALRNLRRCDILLTTPHMLAYAKGLPRRLLRKMKVHRLVVDEAHLMADRGGRGVADRLRSIQTSRTWLVSGTPFSTSLDQLEAQSALLGCRPHGGGDLKLLGLHMAPPHAHLGHKNGNHLRNETIVDWLRSRMIRHTKRQRIGGDVALALPDADCKTLWLEMSEDERLLYGMHECSNGHTLKIEEASRPSTSIYRGEGTRFEACAHIYDDWVIAGNTRDGAGYYSIERPSQVGKHKEASLAYQRTWATKQVVKPHPTLPGKTLTTTERVIKPTLTKYKALLDDLARLRDEEPAFRAVVFTRFDTVQKRLVEILKEESTSEAGCLHYTRRPAGGSSAGGGGSAEGGGGGGGAGGGDDAAAAAEGRGAQRGAAAATAAAAAASKAAGKAKLSKAAAEKEAKEHRLKIYEFNKSTAPPQRHRRISEFQNGESLGPKVFVVTYATAAVGITLTAATRVYLMEPCPDPAQEVQAAGRIHRLGQTRDIFIKRFAFKDSIEAATCALHDKIKAGECVLRDGKFPERAHELFRQFGPAGKLFQRVGEAGSKHTRGEGLIDWCGATAAPRRKPGVPPKLSRWARSCSEEECVLCGAKRLAPKSSTWSGSGIFSYLNHEPHKHADPPVAGTGVGAFGAVPAPPDKWMPERFKAKGFLALINTRAEKNAALEKLEEEEERRGGGPSGGGSGAAGSSSGGGRRGSGAAGDAIELSDSDDGHGGHGGHGGEEGEEGDGAGTSHIMLSDDGEDYVYPGDDPTGKTFSTHGDRLFHPVDNFDCSEGDTDELASDYGGDALDQLRNVPKSGSTADLGKPWYMQIGSELNMFGATREDARKVMEASEALNHVLSLKRGSRAPAPTSKEDLEAMFEADDEAEAEEAGGMEQQEEEGAEGVEGGASSSSAAAGAAAEEDEEMDEEEALYADWFSETLKSKAEYDPEADDDGGPSNGRNNDEFYGGRRAEAAAAAASARAAYGRYNDTSDDDSYCSYDPYDDY